MTASRSAPFTTHQGFAYGRSTRRDFGRLRLQECLKGHVLTMPLRIFLNRDEEKIRSSLDMKHWLYTVRQRAGGGSAVTATSKS
jgi:hypothetical protein